MRGTDTNPQPYFTVLSDFLLNQREFITELHSRVNQFASQKEAAKAWGSRNRTCRMCWAVGALQARKSAMLSATSG